jgi:hypothetical protein
VHHALDAGPRGRQEALDAGHCGVDHEGRVSRVVDIDGRRDVDDTLDSTSGVVVRAGLGISWGGVVGRGEEDGGWRKVREGGRT